MPLTRPIPEDAYPILELIRKEVPRPKNRPRMITFFKDTKGMKPEQRIRWHFTLYKGFGNIFKCYDFLEDGRFCVCPMGMLKCAHGPSPGMLKVVDINDEICIIFYTWFDQQTDIDAVMDAIWPKELVAC